MDNSQHLRMKISKRKLIWKFYCLYFSLFVIQNARQMFVPFAAKNFYYYFLFSFHPFFYFIYALAIAQVLLNIIHLIPLWGYAFDRPAAFPSLWRILLPMRFIFDMAGHSYEAQFLQALYCTHPQFFYLAVLSSVLLYLPSYTACFLYAFADKTAKKGALPQR